MKYVIMIPDQLAEELETLAQDRGFKRVETMIERNVETLKTIDNTKLQILLDSPDLSKISAVVGGANLKTSTDVVNLMLATLRLSVNGIDVTLDPVDANAIKEQFVSTTYPTYAQYVNDTINEAMSTYLWGSTRGILAY